MEVFLKTSASQEQEQHIPDVSADRRDFRILLGLRFATAASSLRSFDKTEFLKGKNESVCRGAGVDVLSEMLRHRC